MHLKGSFVANNPWLQTFQKLLSDTALVNNANQSMEATSHGDFSCCEFEFFHKKYKGINVYREKLVSGKNAADDVEPVHRSCLCIIWLHEIESRFEIPFFSYIIEHFLVDILALLSLYCEVIIKIVNIPKTMIQMMRKCSS